MNETQEIVREQFKKLPKNMQDAILSANLSENLKAISEKHHFRIDQAGTFETEVMLVMLGLERTDAFAKSIEREIEISKEVAEQITKDVNDQIFLPIRESLKQIQSQNNDEEEEEEEDEEEENDVNEKREEGKIPVPDYNSEPETIVPTNLPTGDISELKLGGLLKIPGEEKDSGIEKKPIQKMKNDSGGIDPYREPLG